MKPIPIQSVKDVYDQASFVKLLRDELAWPIQDDLKLEDITFDWFIEDIGLKPDDLRGSRFVQLRPFQNDQPWGIFFVELKAPRLYVTEFRKILRALSPMKRKHKDYPTWNPKNLLFICTPDWKNYTFAHFEGEDAQKAKIATFGWEYQSSYIRTVCEFNLKALQMPESDMFNIPPKVWIDQWSAAFDVKRVTKQFYMEYDKIFKNIKRLLAQQFKVSPKLYDKKPDEWTEKDEKADEPLHLFVQNLVNRLMFLKFLEKRKWLDFNSSYLSDLYRRALAEGVNFYTHYLHPVFFAGLNWQIDLIVLDGEKIHATAQQFQERIGVLPFLNGGLFEKDEVDDRIEIPNEAFKELFDLFSRYNFTINEDTPLDVEVAVNPEMLGKVFEESVIARKEKGAYYTPRHIVSFMCREALKNSLKAKCEITNVSEKVDALVDKRSTDLLAEKDSLEIYKALYSLKVLDPAVGSGAFIVGMMLEIVEIYKLIGEKLERDHPYIAKNKLANPHDVYLLKKQIIQNNLYGVDIEEFATNIARLRLWLSLAVDFPIEFKNRDEFIEKSHKIEPLPNLLYKIKKGDSLLANYGGVSLEPHGRIATGEFNRERKRRILSSVEEIAAKKIAFFTQKNSAEKQKLHHEIQEKLKNLVLVEIGMLITKLNGLAGQDNLFGLTAKEKKERDEILDEVARLEAVQHELEQAEELPDDFPVIWDVDFGEVMNDGGFDVVIANPPYVRQEELKAIKDELALHYDCYTGTSDLYVYFYERGIRLLKPSGTLAYISSNKFFRAGYGAKLREYLTTQTHVNTIIDFGDLPVFEAITYPCVLIATKTLTPQNMAGREFQLPTHIAREKVGSEAPSQHVDNVVRARTVASEEELDRFEEVFRREAITMRQSDLGVEGWRIEDRQVLGLLEKIKKAGVMLQEYVHGKIYYGIKTGYNEAFVIDEKTKQQLIKEDKKSVEVIKPFLRGRDIKRYVIDYQELHLIYIPNGWTNLHRKKEEAEKFFKSKFPSIYEHLKLHEKPLRKRDDQGDYWWEMRPCKYLEEFEKPKLLLPDISPIANFGLDTKGGFYCLNTAYVISTQDNYCLGVLNSAVTTYAYSRISSTVRGGYLRFIYQYITQLPIATPSDKQRRAIEERVEKVLAMKKNGKADTSALEKEIDVIVYKLYSLTFDEVMIVDPKFGMSKEEYEND